MAPNIRVGKLDATEQSELKVGQHHEDRRQRLPLLISLLLLLLFCVCGGGKGGIKGGEKEATLRTCSILWTVRIRPLQSEIGGLEEDVALSFSRPSCQSFESPKMGLRSYKFLIPSLRIQKIEDWKFNRGGIKARILVLNDAFTISALLSGLLQ